MGSAIYLTLQVLLLIYIYIYIGIVKNVSFFRCSAAAKYFAAKILYPQLLFICLRLVYILALNGARASPGTLLTIQLDTLFYKYRWQSLFMTTLISSDVIRNG